MKTQRLFPSLLVGVLAVLSVLILLGQSREAAAEWEGDWYWKDGGWIDYAPNGVPDFDQKQDCWGTGPCPPGGPPSQWTFCGPVAAANSLWWFDSKFEPSPIPPLGAGPPSPHNDNYFLVTSYGHWPPNWDDHDPANISDTLGLVTKLACFLDTDGSQSGAKVLGTNVYSLSYGLQQYLYNSPSHFCNPPAPTPRADSGSYYDDYHVQLVKMPTWEWVVEEVERSEDVVLLLGFWQEQLQPDGTIKWVRVGGHYVTVVGVNAAGPEIAFSDPYYDNAELGHPGRVLSGTIIKHSPIPGHGTHVHNDAGNVSHDAYPVTLGAVSPGGGWEIVGYPFELTPEPNFERQNCPDEFQDMQGDLNPVDPIFTEVEYALAMSPFYWKPGGEWVHVPWKGQWIWEWWWYEDDGDSCLPDFAWGKSEAWYDGPTAVANSLWWFDSKAETLITEGRPKPPPAMSDHYKLVTAYGGWDDHAVTNTLPFIKDLAGKFLETTPAGTSRKGMAAGINAYLADRGAADDFYVKTQDLPSFEWIADEVETSEDVILLLGFYEDLDGNWERKGGHWVNAAGVNREHNLIGLSDPTLDNANNHSISDTLYLGRVFPPEHLGTGFTAQEKLDPQSISHDIYVMTTTLSAISPDQQRWVLADYPVLSVVKDFVGLNEGGTLVHDPGHAFETVVEWAIGVSPYSDLVISKTATLTQVVPGDTVTYTIFYANTGLAAVENVTITDMLPLDSVEAVTYTSDPPISASPGVTYVWTLPRLSYGQKGVISVTVQSLVNGILTNTVYITGLNAIGRPTPDRDPSDNFALLPAPQWSKFINGKDWATEFALQTFDELEVVDVISTFHAISLTEVWDPDHLSLTGHQLEPPGAGSVISGAGWLSWAVPPSQVVTLTKLFQIQPCTWTETTLVEVLHKDTVLLERRPVHIQKLQPTLEIGADYLTEVTAGTEATFTLTYANSGGYENDVLIYNEFPAEALFARSDPPPDRVGADLRRAEWQVGDLPQDAGGNITVTISISPDITPCNWITVTDWIYDHVRTPADVVHLNFHVQCAEVTSVSLSITNTNTIYTDTVVFFSADIAPDFATKPYTYTITYDGLGISLPSTGSEDPLHFTHTFGTTGTHTVQIGVWNCDMTEPVTDTVEVIVTQYGVCVDITGVELTMLTAGDIYTDTLVQFSADIAPNNATKPYTYTIDFGDGTIPITTGSSDDPLAVSHTFLATGTHTVEIGVWNCDMTEPVSDTVEVTVTQYPICEDVTSVDLTLLTAGTIYTDTLVQFSADIAPDFATKPYTYTITYDGLGISLPSTGSEDPLHFTHTFGTTGTHTVQIGVWNCDMTEPVTDTVEVIVTQYGVCVDVTGVQLTMLTAGDIYTDTLVQFSADIAPDNATRPFTHTVDYDDGMAPITTGGSDDPLALSHTFATTGTHNVGIAVWNCVMSATQALTDTVQVRVSERKWYVFLPVVLRGFGGP